MLRSSEEKACESSSKEEKLAEGQTKKTLDIQRLPVSLFRTEVRGAFCLHVHSLDEGRGVSAQLFFFIATVFL